MRDTKRFILMIYQCSRYDMWKGLVWLSGIQMGCENNPYKVKSSALRRVFTSQLLSLICGSWNCSLSLCENKLFDSFTYVGKPLLTPPSPGFRVSALHHGHRPQQEARQAGSGGVFAPAPRILQVCTSYPFDFLVGSTYLCSWLSEFIYVAKS